MTGVLAQAVFFGLPVLLTGTRRHSRFLRWMRRERAAATEWQQVQAPLWAEIHREITVEHYGKHAWRPGGDCIPVRALLAWHGRTVETPRRWDADAATPTAADTTPIIQEESICA